MQGDYISLFRHVTSDLRMYQSDKTHHQLDYHVGTIYRFCFRMPNINENNVNHFKAQLKHIRVMKK